MLGPRACFASFNFLSASWDSALAFSNAAFAISDASVIRPYARETCGFFAKTCSFFLPLVNFHCEVPLRTHVDAAFGCFREPEHRLIIGQ